MLLWALFAKTDPRSPSPPSKAPRVPGPLTLSSSGPVLLMRPRLHPVASCFKEQLTRGGTTKMEGTCGFSLDDVKEEHFLP